MAGGWGSPIEIPQVTEMPGDVPSRFMLPTPEMAEIPLVESTRLVKPAMKRLPTIQGGARMASRVEEQAKEAADIGAAYGFSKLQDKIMRAKARAKGRMAEQQPKRQGKQVVRAGRRSGRAARENMYRTARSEARMRGIGTDIFKRAKL